jgi:hypothetical protein
LCISLEETEAKVLGEQQQGKKIEVEGEETDLQACENCGNFLKGQPPAGLSVAGNVWYCSNQKKPVRPTGWCSTWKKKERK